MENAFSCFIPRFVFPILGTIHNGDFYSNPMLLTQVCSMDHTLRNTVLVEIWRILYTRDWRRKCSPLQYSCLENPRHRGAWWAAVYGVPQSRTLLKRLSSSSSSIHKRGTPGDSVVKNLPAMQKMQETRVRSLGWKDPLEEGMATPFSILAWRIPWTVQPIPGRLQSIGSHRVRQTEAT